MAVTFGPDALMVEKAVAADALQQLFLMSVFTQASLGGYEEGAFEMGDTVKFRRIRITEAEDYDPRTGSGANETEPGYVTGDTKLEKLFTNAIPVYHSDVKIQQYINETGPSMAYSIATAFERYLYSKLRTPTHASTGQVRYGVDMPIRIVAAADTAPGKLGKFDQDLLVNGSVCLEEENTPPGELYAILATRAKGDYIGEQTPVDAGMVYAQSQVAALLQRGLPIGQFVQRMGFNVGGSNIIKTDGTQMGVADLDTASSAQASLAIASMSNNTDFVKADYATTTYLGAIDFVLTCTGLQNVAVGQIARIGPDSGAATAYGVVLRVNTGSKTVTLVPFAPDGTQLTTSDISTSTDKFSIPRVGSINVGYKKQALIRSARQMMPPEENAGAQVVTAADDDTGLALQIWTGNYQINKFKSSRRYSFLTGAKFTDYRQGVLMLSR